MSTNPNIKTRGEMDIRNLKDNYFRLAPLDRKKYPMQGDMFKDELYVIWNNRCNLCEIVTGEEALDLFLAEAKSLNIGHVLTRFTLMSPYHENTSN